MRIQHVVVSMDPAQGGPPAVAARLAAAQAGLGHEVSIACQDSPGREREVEASIKSIPGIDRVEFARASAVLRLGAIIPRATRKLLRHWAAQADIVHLHSVWEPLVRQASVECRRVGVPYVVTPHGVLDPWCLKQSWLKKKIALWLTYRRMLDEAACLHLLNKDEANLIEPLGLKAPRGVIPNGVFLEEIDPLPGRGTFYADHPELKGAPYVLFLSRLHFKKGLDYLAAAFELVAKSHPSARLVVAGPDGGARAAFEQRIADAGLGDRVHMVGPLWGTTKLAAMVDAACFCLPSRQEGFSMAIVEALACGTPVVISDACHFPEVADARAGEVAPLDVPAIASALGRVLDTPDMARRMGVAGRALVVSNYTWPRIAQQAVTMYEAALAPQTRIECAAKASVNHG